MARRGKARLGEAGSIKFSMAGRGEAGPGEAWLGKARQGKVYQVQHDGAWPGRAGQGKARQGKARSSVWDQEAAESENDGGIETRPI